MPTTSYGHIVHTQVLSSSSFGSGAGTPVTRSGPDVRSFGSADALGAGRPVLAGRPVVGTFPSALLLLRLLIHLPLLLVLAP